MIKNMLVASCLGFRNLLVDCSCKQSALTIMQHTDGAN